MMTDEQTDTTSPQRRLTGWPSFAKNWLRRYGKTHKTWYPLVAFFIASGAVLSLGVYVDRWYFWVLDIPVAVAAGALALIVTWEEVR